MRLDQTRQISMRLDWIRLDLGQIIIDQIRLDWIDEIDEMRRDSMRLHQTDQIRQISIRLDWIRFRFDLDQIRLDQKDQIVQIRLEQIRLDWIDQIDQTGLDWIRLDQITLILVSQILKIGSKTDQIN